VNLVSIDAASPVPPFEQLRAQLAALVRTGAIRAGAKLPTVRQLANDLGLAKNTVARAYAALEQEGLVRGDRRLGTTVIGAPLRSPAQRAHLVREAARRFLLELEALNATPDDGVHALLRAAGETR
jgi:DNA-binding transcriptional regulator YhcF (GntR family)